MEPENEVSLNFTPVTQGLGFHSTPISTPQSFLPETLKSRLKSSSELRFEPSPLVNSLPQKESAENNAAIVALPVNTPINTPINTEETLLFLKRAIAFLIDMAINSLFCLFALAIPVLKNNIPLSQLLAQDFLFPALTYVLVFSWLAVLAQEIAFGSSIGKRVFCLAITGEPVAVLIRGILFVPSLLLGGIGLVWSLFEKHGLALHDLASGTRVYAIVGKNLGKN
jgi:uncharacterized RDD family membrane protein YckC